MIKQAVSTAVRERPRLSEWWWVLVSALLVVYIAGAVVPVTYWIEVYNLEVSDAETPQEVTVRVDREIHRPFLGSYQVEVRNAFGWHICTVPLQDYTLRYKRRARGEGISGEGTVSLAWWLGGDDMLQFCSNKGLIADGVYRIVTCHTVEEPFAIAGFSIYPPREKCWKSSNFFKIGQAS